MRDFDFGIKRIILEQFKCFEKREIMFNKNFTLLVGNNGTGKTTILDALAIAIGGFLNGFGDLERNDKRTIHTNEVRREQIELGNAINVEAQYPVKITCETNIDETLYKWTRFRENKGNAKFADADAMRAYVRKIQKEVASPTKSGSVILPVFAYHGTGRLWAKTNITKAFEGGTSRYLGYKNCLNPKSNENLFTAWFRETRRMEIDEGIKSVELSAVSRAIEKFLGGGNTKFRYNLKAKEIQVTLDNGKLLPFHMLSDGYRNAIGMVADTAFRMVVLNPQLQDEAIRKTPGVILIDEIELHLHPEWQMTIVDSFKNTFPKAQIIATTHAPIVISTCKEDEIVKLEDQGIEYVSNTYGWLAEDVIKTVMGLDSSRHPQIEAKINEYRDLYYKKLSDEATEDDLDKMNKIAKWLYENLPAHDPVVTLTKLEATKKKVLSGE